MTDAQPLILAFDTSTQSCDVAVVRGDKILAQRSEALAKGQAERLLGLCQEVLQDAGANLPDLAAIAVGVGPGNFTGIRISVAAARGLALGLKIPAVGVTSFEALHFEAHLPCICAVDARRDQVYVQEFDAAGGSSAPVLTQTAALTHPVIGHGGSAPAQPRAVAMARIAAGRYKANPPRPAPLYLRPADAAPARDAPPRILT